MKLSSLAFRNLRRNKRRTMISVFAVGLTAMLITLMFSMIEGMNKDMVELAQDMQSGEVRITDSLFKEDDLFEAMPRDLLNADEVAQALASLDYVDAIAPRIVFAAAVIEGSRQLPAFGIGMDFEKEKQFINPAQYLLEGAMPEEGSDEILISKDFAQKIKIKVGERITLSTFTRPYIQAGLNMVSFTVSGIFHINANGFQGSLVFAPLQLVRDWIRLPSGCTSLILRVEGDPIKRADDIGQNLKIQNGLENVSVKSWTQIGMAKFYVDMFDFSMIIMAVIFFALASTVLINTVIMIIYERKKEIGALSAMGMEGKDLIRLFFLEALFMSIIGSVAGIAVGVLCSLGLDSLRFDWGSMMTEIDFNMSNVLRFAINWKSTVLVFVFSVTVSAITSLIPVQKAARIEPVEALRDD